MTTNINNEHEDTPEHINAVNNLVAKIRGDGCTAAPDFHYKHCCDEHDIAYTLRTDENYKPISKWEADKRLFQCIYKKSNTPIGKFVIAPLYWLAVATIGCFLYYGKTR